MIRFGKKKSLRTAEDEQMRARIDERASAAEEMLRAVRARTAALRELSEEAVARLERNHFGSDLTESMRRR